MTWNKLFKNYLMIYLFVPDIFWEGRELHLIFCFKFSTSSGRKLKPSNNRNWWKVNIHFQFNFNIQFTSFRNLIFCVCGPKENETKSFFWTRKNLICSLKMFSTFRSYYTL